jgi:hypothetical protein
MEEGESGFDGVLRGTIWVDCQRVACVMERVVEDRGSRTMRSGFDREALAGSLSTLVHDYLQLNTVKQTLHSPALPESHQSPCPTHLAPICMRFDRVELV